MKQAKRYLAGLLLATLLVTSGTSIYAAELQSPAQVLSALIGIPVEDVYEQRVESTYGEIALEYGVLEEFKSAMLENKKVFLDQKVSEGLLTKEEADAIYAKMVENQENCDGTGLNQGNRLYLGIGNGTGMGPGSGMRPGTGFGSGMGRQMGRGMRAR